MVLLSAQFDGVYDLFSVMGLMLNGWIMLDGWKSDVWGPHSSLSLIDDKTDFLRLTNLRIFEMRYSKVAVEMQARYMNTKNSMNQIWASS